MTEMVYIMAEGHSPVCGPPLEFERGWCHRCGKLLDPVVEKGGAIDNWIALEAAIERGRLDLRERAREAGLDVPNDLAVLPEEERLAYIAWLEDNLEPL